MAKRGATSELNHDNWDAEEPPEIAGTFQKASNDVMQRRIVKVAKRRSAGISDQGAEKNVFSAFQGFKSDSTSKTNSDLSSTFSFLKNNPTTNGVANLPQSLNTVVSSSTNNSPFTREITPTIPVMNNPNEGDKYPAKLIRLNQFVAEWIKSHVDKDPSCILTPIFKDYERYLKEIEEEKNSSSPNKTALKDNANLISSSSLPASSSNQPKDNTGNSSNAKNIIQFPKSSTSESSKVSPTHSIFSSFKTDDSSKRSGISLLTKPDPASLMVNPFTSSLKKPLDDKTKTSDDANKSGIPGSIFKLPQESSSTTGSFSFGGGKIAPFGGTNTSGLSGNQSVKDSNDNDGAAEESDEPPKAEFTPVLEKDAIFIKRCKVFIKKEANYAELGVGTLFIKPVTGEKHQLIVRADTSLGNILVNVLLTSAIPTQRMGKNNVMIICVPTPPPPGSAKQPTPSAVLLRVKTAEEADNLLEILEKYKK